MLDEATVVLLVTVMVVLAIAFIVTRILKRQPEGSIDPSLVRTFDRRVKAWLIIYAILALGIILGRVACVVLFGVVSFWALREFITMTPTRRADHRALFWTFFLFTPLQYLFVGIGSSFYDPVQRVGFDFYLLYTVMIPVYASLVIPARIALSDDHKRFLERSAKVQFALLVCVYALSHAPAILDLRLNHWDAKEERYQPWNYSIDADEDGNAENAAKSDNANTTDASSNQIGDDSVNEYKVAGLLIYFIVIVQLSEVAQYFWDRMIGKHVVAPSINATKSWEGFFAGILTTAVFGVLFWFTGVTPFTWHGSALMSLVIAIMGFNGSITMSAIKRDRGVEDYGTLVQGHAGVLDRIDSMCFAAPMFFHLTRFFLGAQ